MVQKSASSSNVKGTVYNCSICREPFNSLEQLRAHRITTHQPEGRNRRRPHPEPAIPSTSRGVDGPTHTPKRSKSEGPVVDDPIQPTPDLLPEGNDELTQNIQQVYIEHWSAIRTHHRNGQVQDMYNFRIQDLNVNHLRDQLQDLFRSQVHRFKVNASFGFILQNLETGQLCYYHSSHNVGRLLDAPQLINNQEDFDAFLEDIIHERYT